MGRYVTVVFADLERQTDAWSRIARDDMVSILAEYRYLAESLAGQYGCLYLEWAGDGHMFVFESPDAAARFGLELIPAWRSAARAPLSLRLGCHFGECTPMEGAGWIGRGTAVAKRVEGAADPDTLQVTEAVLDLLDLPLYEFEPAGVHILKGDSVPERRLYRVTRFDRAALEARSPAKLRAEDWFLEGAAMIGTSREWSDEEAACYERALELRPDYAEAHNNYAVLLRSRGRDSEAAHHYQEALRIRPDYPEAHANYAALLAARGSLAGAEEHYREALRLRPDSVDAHHGYAGLLSRRNSLAEAEEHYRETLRLRPKSPEAHSNYAILLERLDRMEEADAHYREALRLRPEYPEAHYNYALLLEDRGESRAAEAHYREALRLWPDYAEAHNNLAVLLQGLGDTAEAVVHHEAALRLRPDDPEVHYNYALLLRREGDVEGADRHFRTAYELAPEVPAFRSALESPS